MAQKVASLYAEIGADTSGLTKGLGRAKSELGETATQLDKTGGAADRMGGFLKGAAVAGFGALVAGVTASVHAAAELETSMGRIAALTDTPRGAIQGLTKDVIAMSREIPVSSGELAKGLYFISSSGFQGAEAMNILRSSAKAAAAGLGETKTIADAVTSALNAYKLGSQDAARITDILTQAVKEGKGEPAELAGSLGRVLPVAAAAGVSMEQVAASLATMTRTGLSADEAATALRGTIGALLAPSKQAKDALAGMGLSVEQLAKMLREQGLVSVLQTLMERTHGNVEALDAIIPNIRALTGVLSTAGSQADDYAEILEKMSNAAGTTDKAFGEMSKTFEFKLKKAQNSIENLGIAVGQKLLPPLSDAADAATTLINWQAKLGEAFSGTEVKIREQSKTYDEYREAVIATAKAAGAYTEVNNLFHGSVVTVTDDFHMLTEAQWKLARAQEANVGLFDESDRAARRSAEAGIQLAKSSQDVEYQAILTAKELKAQAAVTEELREKAADAAIGFYDLAESLIKVDKATFVKQALQGLDQALKDGAISTEQYRRATEELLISQGLATPKSIEMANAVGMVDSLMRTGKLSTADYTIAMQAIPAAAADGKVNLDELGGGAARAARLMGEAAERAEHLQRKIAALQSKTINVTTIFNEKHEAGAGGLPGGRQHGGPVARGRPYLIGERGPELFVPNTGGFVMDNTDTRRMIALLESIARNQRGNQYTLNVGGGAPGADVIRDFGLMQALAGA